MMRMFDVHEHQCHVCNRTWVCSNRECDLTDECGECGHRLFEEYAEARDWFDSSEERIVDRKT
jgi:hypothetical protein